MRKLIFIAKFENTLIRGMHRNFCRLKLGIMHNLCIRTHLLIKQMWTFASLNRKNVYTTTMLMSTLQRTILWEYLSEFSFMKHQINNIPNIRKCIGVGGLNDPQANNTIFVDDTIFVAQINTRQLNILMRQSFSCFVEFENMMHLFDRRKVREKCQQCCSSIASESIQFIYFRNSALSRMLARTFNHIWNIDNFWII